MLRIVSPKSKERCRALRGIMSRQRKIVPITPPVGYRHQCYCRMICGGTALVEALIHHVAMCDLAMSVDETALKEISTEA